MAFNLDLTLLLAIAVSACSGTESNHPSAGGTGALGGSSSSGGNGGSATTTGGTAPATSIGGHSSGGSPQMGGSQATSGGRTSIIGCSARPDGDAMCSGATPHFFTCVGDTPQNTGCEIRSIGDMTDTYCCP